MFEQWRDFKGGNWSSTINVRDFIVNNYKPYNGDEGFLKGPSIKTKKLWDTCEKLLENEAESGGVLDIDTGIISGITSHNPGFIDKENEIIFGLQTDKPLKRGVNIYGGFRVAMDACKAN